MTLVESILDDAANLPTLPSAVVKLSAMLDDDRSSARDFELVIKPDPALTANLLRLTNSPYFGLGRQVYSVGHAVTILGMKRLFEVATSAAFASVIPAELRGYQQDARSFWGHCVAVAVMSELLATELSIKVPEMTFTAGLLHDVGKLAISAHLAREASQITRRLHEGDADFISIERETLGTDHCEVGGALAERWNLPEQIGWAARWHHDIREDLDRTKRTMVDIIHIADCLAHTMGFGNDIGELSRTPNEGAIERLGVNVRQLELVACRSLEKISDMETLNQHGKGV